MKKQQLGFIRIHDGAIETLIVLAAIGCVALVAGFLYGAWWLLTHIRVIA